MIKEKYMKIVYQTPPIGEYGIVLYLTTFDIEALKRDELLEKTQKIELPVVNHTRGCDGYLETTYIDDCCYKAYPAFYNTNDFARLEEDLNAYIRKYYECEVERLRTELKICRENLYLKNVSNANRLECNSIQGNVSNCNNVYCNEIAGDICNCTVRPIRFDDFVKMEDYWK